MLFMLTNIIKCIGSLSLFKTMENETFSNFPRWVMTLFNIGAVTLQGVLRKASTISLELESTDRQRSRFEELGHRKRQKSLQSSFLGLCKSFLNTGFRSRKEDQSAYHNSFYYPCLQILQLCSNRTMMVYRANHFCTCGSYTDTHQRTQ